MKPNFKERGQVLVFIAAAAIGLVAIVALAVDGGAKYSDRRHAQNAADTAALAAALTKVNGLTFGGQTDSVCSTNSGYVNSSFCLDIINAAWDRAEENGYQGLIPNSVDVYSPPISGPYINDHSYVQVIITSYVNTFFARVIGIAQTRNIVEAVAETGKGGKLGDGAAFIALDPNPGCSSGGGAGGGSFDFGGSGTVHLSGGGLFVNSSATCGYSQTSCMATLDISGGATIYSAGSAVNLGGCASGVTPNTTQQQYSIPSDVIYPKVPPECGTTAPTPTLLGTDPSDGKPEWLIYPGYYTDFPQASLIPNNKHIYMSSGVYCIDPPHDQDLGWSGSSFLSLNGSTDPSKNRHQSYSRNGVTLYIKSGGGFSFSINSPILLDASTSGDYQGYLVILEGNQGTHPSCILNGGTYLDINGIIFAPYCDMTINGSNSTDSVFNAQFIAWHVQLNGNNNIAINYDPDRVVKIKRRIGLMR